MKITSITEFKFYLSRDDKPYPEDHYILWTGGHRPKKYKYPPGRWISSISYEKASWAIFMWDSKNFPYKNIHLDKGKCIEINIDSISPKKRKKVSI
jgi:hypothetical protein